MLPQTGLPRLYQAATATRRARFVSAAAVIAVAGVGIGVGVTQTGDSPATPKPTTTVAKPKPAPRTAMLTLSGFQQLAKTLRRPVYWVGPQAGTDYELTTAPDGRIFLRYVAAGLEPRAKGAYLSVGTYPLAHAFTATIRASRKKGFVRVQTANGVAAVYARGRPTNVYLAFRGVDYQVEVFHPQPSVARRLVAQGRVVPVT